MFLNFVESLLMTFLSITGFQIVIMLSDYVYFGCLSHGIFGAETCWYNCRSFVMLYIHPVTMCCIVSCDHPLSVGGYISGFNIIFCLNVWSSCYIFALVVIL